MSMSEAPTLDEVRSVRETGAVYTPLPIAKELVRFSASLLPGKVLSVLEPSAGDGVFIEAMKHHGVNGAITLVDIDPGVIGALADKCRELTNFEGFVSCDFIEFASRAYGERSFDLVIGNPPFIRRHNFSQEHLGWIRLLADISGVPSSVMKNSWAAFLVATVLLLSGNGVVCFVLPYELLTVKYGKDILSWLCARLYRVDVYISRSRAFKDIDQDAVVLCGQNGASDRPGGFFVNSVDNLEDLSRPRQFEVNIGNKDGGLSLNSHLIAASHAAEIGGARLKVSSIGDYCRSAPGVVTAANDFFIMSEGEARRRRIMGSTVPVLRKSSRDLVGPVLTSEFLDLTSEVSPSRLLALSAERELGISLAKYIEEGERQGIDKRYKCRNRTPWYSVPLVKAAPCFIFKRSHSHPRVIVNDANVVTTDSAYGIYPNDGVDARGICFSFYNSLTMLFAEISGRFYGGGVLELSPLEFRSLPLPYIQPTRSQFAKFAKLYEEGEASFELALDHGDECILAGGTLSRSELLAARHAWKAVRAHRLRHAKQTM
jgi:adenine-specific DNA-methyltransferase